MAKILKVGAVLEVGRMADFAANARIARDLLIRVQNSACFNRDHEKAVVDAIRALDDMIADNNESAILDEATSRPDKFIDDTNN